MSVVWSLTLKVKYHELTVAVLGTALLRRFRRVASFCGNASHVWVVCAHFFHHGQRLAQTDAQTRIRRRETRTLPRNGLSDGRQT